MIRHRLAANLHPPQGRPGSTSVQLLVSVRNAEEAVVAQNLGVQWIDLKNPDAGSLGPAPASVAQAVAGTLRGGAAAPPLMMSAAAGELRDAPLATALKLAQLFPLVKVGLSGMGGQTGWQSQFRDLALQLHAAGTELVPVIYADHHQSGAPQPHEVLAVAEEIQVELEPGWQDQAKPRFLLIDTHTKDGRRLLDWFTLAQLSEICAQARATGRQTVLAGSLRAADVPQLLPLAPAAVAVRGAVCTSHRRSNLCPQKVTQWLELVQNR